MKHLFLLSLLCVSCVTECPEPIVGPVPTFDGQLYVGDAAKKAVVRAQSNTEISCSDERFSEMVCMAHSDFLELLTELKGLRERVRGMAQ